MTSQSDAAGVPKARACRKIVAEDAISDDGDIPMELKIREAKTGKTKSWRKPTINASQRLVETAAIKSLFSVEFISLPAAPYLEATSEIVVLAKGVVYSLLTAA